MKKHLCIKMMYRDGANFKEHTQEIYDVDVDMTDEEIIEIFQPWIDTQEDFVPSYYGLQGCAALKNEFLNTHNDYEHSFCTITDVIFKEYPDEGLADPLSGVIQAFQNPKIVRERKREALIKTMAEHISYLSYLHKLYEEF